VTALQCQTEPVEVSLGLQITLRQAQGDRITMSALRQAQGSLSKSEFNLNILSKSLYYFKALFDNPDSYRDRVTIYKGMSALRHAQGSRSKSLCNFKALFDKLRVTTELKCQPYDTLRGACRSFFATSKHSSTGSE